MTERARAPSKVCWSMMRRLCTSTSSPKEVSCGAVLLENSLLELTLLDRAWGQRALASPARTQDGRQERQGLNRQDRGADVSLKEENSDGRQPHAA